MYYRMVTMLSVLMAPAAVAQTCARVALDISQTSVIARSGFRGTLTINNNTDSDYLNNVRVVVRIRDGAGNPADDRFQVRPPDLTGISNVGGLGGSVGPHAAAIASYTIVPLDDAASAGPTPYDIGGTLSYQIGGNSISVDFFPARVTAVPNPHFTVKYFLERDVIGDDPFTTDIVEPSVPFSLGLMMSNTGLGSARNVQITSAAPQITDNTQRDLLISFQLVGTQVGAQSIPASLAVNLGDIPSSTTRVARWLFTSSLQGKFKDYSAGFRHVDGLGNPRASLVDIDTFRFYELAHVVRADMPDDQVPDFLTYATGSMDRIPDNIHLSDGSVAPVTTVTDAMVNVSAANTAATIIVPSMPSGWSYIRVEDPFGGSGQLASVVRSDGKVILPEYNAWLTNRTIRVTGQPPMPDHHVHIFDQGGTGIYLATFVPANNGSVQAAWQSLSNHGSVGLAPVPLSSEGTGTEPSAAGVGVLRARLSGPVQAASVSSALVRLFGSSATTFAPINLSSTAIARQQSSDGRDITLSFSPPLAANARYCLYVDGLTDAFGRVVPQQQVEFASLVGDVNGDRSVTSADAAAVSALISPATIDPGNAAQVRADVDGDGVVTQHDADIAAANAGRGLLFAPPPCPDVLFGQLTPDQVTRATITGAQDARYRHGDYVLRMLQIAPIDPFTYESSVLQSRNSRGDAIAWESDASGHSQSFVRMANGQVIQLGTLGGSSTIARAINDAGQVVGASERSDSIFHAFRYTPGLSLEDLGSLAPGASDAFGLSSSGFATGTSASGPDRQSPFAFVDPTGLISTGDLGGVDGVGKDVSDAPLVVGSASDSRGKDRAIAWDQNIALVDLNNAMPSGSGWELESANRILSDGSVIGYGLFEQVRVPFRMRFDVVQSTCVADFDRSGGVTLNDLFTFLAAYFADDLAADLNHNGIISVQDIFDFIILWTSGCP